VQASGRLARALCGLKHIMCGICGIYEYGLSEPAITASLVVGMRDTMAHRGPDDAGTYISPDGRVGLGHRRLSIVDLSPAGRNPMSNEDESIWITFNGEIYNHQSLRPALIEAGHTYRSRTDTETIIHLYEECGLDFISKLEGFFAIGLWDQRNGSLLLVRDRVGIKPLYYTVAAGRLIFASEIKAILAHPSVSRDIDEESLYHYLTFLATPPPHTLFAGINKLPAGCFLTCNRNGDIRVERYWDVFDSNPRVSLSEDDVASEVYSLLAASVKKRMMSDVPFGVFLSGGIDSTANVALMSRMMSDPVRTFTVGFRDDPVYNELEEARQVAREYGTDHHEIIISQQDLLDSLPEIIFHQDEPIADPVCVPLLHVSKLAKETGTTVVQVGEGSDELFCGYSDYVSYLNLYNRGWRQLTGLPHFIRKAVSLTGLAAFRLGAGHLLPKGRKMVPDLLRRLTQAEELFWSGAFVFDEVYKSRLFSAATLERLAARNGGQHLSSYSVVRADLDRLLAVRSGADQLQRMIYLDLKLRLPELLLMRVDKVTMAASIEARVPFLDHKLVEFAMNIPSELKHRGGETKYILKRALQGHIPDWVLRRKKKGFGAPINEWMLQRLGRMIDQELFNSPLRGRQLFDYSFIKQILEEQRRGRANNSFFLWALLNLSLWYDHWIEGQPSLSWASSARASVDEENARLQLAGQGGSRLL
jgi:asparagine synthase (glutamine-hydrolysing)